MSETQIPSPETNDAPRHFAISFEDLDQTTWESVLAIYMHDASGIDLEPNDDLLYMFPLEKIHPGMGLRLGSRISPHSKLEIQTKGFTPNDMPLVTFGLYPNEGNLTDQQKEEAEAMKEQFQKDIDALLVLTGNSVPLDK